nr:hypothetical protein [uncultured Cohaesibacter sp.]
MSHQVMVAQSLGLALMAQPENGRDLLIVDIRDEFRQKVSEKSR